jgi:prepilin-type N-terminal cleavage/methylation domain-containing protein
MFFLFFKKSFLHIKKEGFTLIELLIVLSIVIIISTIVLAGYDDYQFRSALTIAKEELAVTIREAQVYGISIRGESSDNINYRFPNYGVNINPSARPNSILIFADIDRSSGNIGFNTPGDVEIRRYNIKPPFVIQKACINTTTSLGNEVCTGSGSMTSVDIIFERPEPEPIVKSNLVGSALYASIYVTGPEANGSHYVRIWNNGQISVQP